MRIVNDSLFAFDYTFPLYNWFYPFTDDLTADDSRLPQAVRNNKLRIFEHLKYDNIEKRALYFHVPYCEDICAFCPFARSVPRGPDTVERYVQALIREIELKAQYPSVSSVPVHAIFFGGGTPSILTADQIRHVGSAIHKHFNLSKMKEFSFEMNVKSVTPDKVAALRDIGVTHARNGVQTFNQKYRDLMMISATVDQVRDVISLVRDTFPFTCIDMLYGFNGQSMDEFIEDLHHASSFNTKTIDVYPINNYVTQARLHKRFADAGLKTTSGLTKMAMNLLGRDYLKGNGYLPHNGHGYTKVSASELAKDPVTTRTYTFEYHEVVYGYSNYDLLGFGAVAVSVLNGMVIENEANSAKYIDGVDVGAVPMKIYPHAEELDAFKGLILHLPYHGYATKSRINVDLAPRETLEALNACMARGLIVETPTEYQLTRDGWNWYVNLLYYLLPDRDRLELDRAIELRRAQPGREVEDSQIHFV